MSSFFLLKDAKIYFSLDHRASTGNKTQLKVGELFTKRGMFIPVGEDSIFILMKLKDPSYDMDWLPVTSSKGMLIKYDGSVHNVQFIPKHLSRDKKTSTIVEELIPSDTIYPGSLMFRCHDVAHSELMAAITSNHSTIEDILTLYKQYSIVDMNFVCAIDIWEIINQNTKDSPIEDVLKDFRPSPKYETIDLRRPSVRRTTQVEYEQMSESVSKQS